MNNHTHVMISKERLAELLTSEMKFLSSGWIDDFYDGDGDFLDEWSFFEASDIPDDWTDYMRLNPFKRFRKEDPEYDLKVKQIEEE